LDAELPLTEIDLTPFERDDLAASKSGFTAQQRIRWRRVVVLGKSVSRMTTRTINVSSSSLLSTNPENGTGTSP
jgi:hypothetical protein